MIKLKGRNSIKQSMPQKPIRRGSKAWVRADCNDYVCQFQIYTGRQSGSPGLGLGERVITDLSAVLENKEYKIYTDFFFLLSRRQ